MTMGVIVTAFGIHRGGAPVRRPALAAESG
jgi:hypothetical protein